MIQKPLFGLVLFLAAFLSSSIHADAGRSASRHYVFLIDNSGSMQRGKTTENLTSFFSSLEAGLQAEDRVSLISVGENPLLVFDKVVKEEEAKTDLIPVKRLFSYNESYTDLKSGFQYAVSFLLSERSGNRAPVVLFLSDGLLDLVSSKYLTFPESLLKDPDYRGILERFSPFMSGTLVAREKVAALNKEVVSLEKQLFEQDVLPTLTKERDPLFVISFAEPSEILEDIAGKTRFQEEVQNFWVLKEQQNIDNFFAAFLAFLSNSAAFPSEELPAVKVEAEVDVPPVENVEEKPEKESEGNRATLFLFLLVVAGGLAGIYFMTREKKESVAPVQAKLKEETAKTVTIEKKDNGVQQKPLQEPQPKRLSKEAEARNAAIQEKLDELEIIKKTMRENEGEENHQEIQEHRQSDRFSVPAGFPLTVRFYNKEVSITGRLRDISEAGCGLTIIDPGYYTGELQDLVGTFEINWQEKTVELRSVRIVHGLSSGECFGVSMTELIRKPETRLVWLTFLVEIFTELSRKRIWR